MITKKYGLRVNEDSWKWRASSKKRVLIKEVLRDLGIPSLFNKVVI